VLFGALCLGLVCGRVQGRRVGDGGDRLESCGRPCYCKFWGDGSHLIAILG